MAVQSGCSSRAGNLWPLLTCLMLVAVCGQGRGESWDGTILQYGEMRQVLGLGRHGSRVQLGDLTERQHCYAVGALENLAGEVTVFDGKIVATRVDKSGKPVSGSGEPKDEKATMLVAAYVSNWSERPIADAVTPDGLERFLRNEAQKAGIDVSKPFPFIIEGGLVSLEIHVINGACPMRAKRLGIRIPATQQPYHSSTPRVEGRIVGIFAPNAAHRLTHHGTATHMHALLKDKEGETYTGHIERVGVAAGAALRLPAR